MFQEKENDERRLFDLSPVSPTWFNHSYHLNLSFKLTNRWLPITRWSSNSMSSTLPASTNCSVTLISSGEGVGSPLGWLWQTMTPGQLRITAGRNISAARKTELLTVPW